MRRIKKPSQSRRLTYPTVVLSDLHLGKRRVVEAAYLIEFLNHIDCETLILNGDVIDGWYLEKHRYCPFPEMHARVLDAINAKTANGTRVIYVAGNHDERIRYQSRAEMEAMRLDPAKPQFHETVTFTARNIECEIEFCNEMNLQDTAGRHMKILHGDVFDPPWVTGSWSIIGDKFYDALVIANNTFSNLAMKFRGGVRFSIAKLIKKNAKYAIGIIANFEAAACNLPDDVDGMICGHIHHAEIAQNKGKLYINSGDWIESCTAAVNDGDGSWRIVHWEEERLKLGLRSLRPLQILNSNRRYREITKKQLRLIHYFWPAKNRSKLIQKGFDWDILKPDLKAPPRPIIPAE